VHRCRRPRRRILNDWIAPGIANNFADRGSYRTANVDTSDLSASSISVADGNTSAFSISNGTTSNGHSVWHD
jgi:hypothetical protein